MENKTPAADTGVKRGSLQDRLLAQIGQNQQATSTGQDGDKFVAARKLEAKTVQAAITAGGSQDAALLQGHPIASLVGQAFPGATNDAAPDLPKYRLGMPIQVGMRFEVSLDDLQDSPVQPRVFVNAERLQEMKTSLAENGQLQHAQVVLPGPGETKLTLREGHTRRRLLRELGKQAMSVEVVAPGKSEEDEAVLAREVNHRRSEITVYDIAVRLCQFLERHRAEGKEPPPGEVLARRFGLSSGSRVSEYMAIGRLPESLLQLLFDGNVGRGSAYQVALVFKRHGHKEALKLVNRLTRVKSSAEALENDKNEGETSASGESANRRQKTLALAMVDGPLKGGVKLMTNGEVVLRLKPVKAGDAVSAAVHAKLLQVLREAGMEVTAAATETAND
jgi:ParB/RepB/Spo0J family partition protein